MFNRYLNALGSMSPGSTSTRRRSGEISPAESNERRGSDRSVASSISARSSYRGEDHPHSHPQAGVSGHARTSFKEGLIRSSLNENIMSNRNLRGSSSGIERTPSHTEY